MITTLPTIAETDRLKTAGARFGPRGTHTSRTMMLSELSELFLAVPRSGSRQDYEAAIVAENCLGKATTANRRSTLQRMSELYGLDPAIPLFGVLRRLWDLDPAGRPMLALLCSLARDPMLRSTAPHILAMEIGSELLHGDYMSSIRDHVETRLNDGVLDQVRRNSSATWTQSGHLEGRVRKRRRVAGASFGPIALALWLGSLEGRVGDDLLASFWMRQFDAPRHAIIDAVLHCKQTGLIYASIGGGIVQIDPAPVFQPSQQGNQ